MPLRKIRAFIKRDIIENMSYKMDFFLNLAVIFAQTLTFFFIARLVGNGEGGVHLFMNDQGAYFPFVLTGMALAGYQAAALQGFATGMTREIGSGTLEAILVTPTPLRIVMLSSALWTLTAATLRILAYLALGVWVFKADLSQINFLTAFLTLFMTMIALAGLGIFTAGFVLVFKRGDPIAYVVDGMSRLFGGVYFPVALFPEKFAAVSKIIPLTHSLSALRKAVLTGGGILSIQSELFALLIFSVILLPSGVFFLSWAVRCAKKNGTLSFA